MSVSGAREDPAEEIKTNLLSSGFNPILKNSSTLNPANQIRISCGWPLLSKDRPGKHFVIHDSLLPKLRGWNPSVTEIEFGFHRKGISIFSASPEIDDGPVVWQKVIRLPHSVSIADLIRAKGLALRGGLEYLATHNFQPRNLCKPRLQRDSWSLWRDSSDYEINWARDASYLERFIRSRGFPYLGALTYLDGNPIRVLDAEVGKNHRVANPSPGKILRIENNSPEICCGSGVVKVLRAEFEETGEQVEFKRIRSRLTQYSSPQ